MRGLFSGVPPFHLWVSLKHVRYGKLHPKWPTCTGRLGETGLPVPTTLHALGPRRIALKQS